MDNRVGYIWLFAISFKGMAIIRVLLIYNMGFAIIKRALTYAYIVHSAEIVSSTDRIITEQSSCRR